MKNLLLLTAATFALPTLGYAQTITESANAPATGVLISQPLSDSLNDQDDFTSTQFGVSAGQSFIPTENLSLSSVTVLGGGDSALSDGDHSDGPTGFNVFFFYALFSFEHILGYNGNADHFFPGALHPDPQTPIISPSRCLLPSA
ncbi:MAG: hypothetical protein WDO13_21580 [Verrucomicrobiota bacterium]